MRRAVTTAILAAGVLVPALMLGQTLSITNYQFISQQPVNATQSQVTYSAALVNSTGEPFGSVTASLSSTNPFSVRTISGESTLNFAPVPGNGEVQSSNTFTILVSNTVPFSFSALQWSFQTTALGVVANAGPNQTVSVGTNVILNGSGSTNPSGVGTLTYSWQFTSRPPGTHTVLVTPLGVNASFVADVAGTYIVTLTVSNGSVTSSASVTITTLNTVPVANAGPNETVALGSTVFLNGGGSTDVDGNPLTYSWTLTSIPPGSTAVLSGATSVSPTFVADKYGSYTAQLIVNDGLSNSLPATVTITTEDTPPVANAGPGQVVAVSALVQLNGSGSTDVNGDLLTYQWSLISLPTGSAAKLSNPAAVNPTFTADVAGTYVAQLIVNDGTYNSAPATVAITTNSILPPTASAGPNQTVGCGASASSPCLQGTTVQLSGSGTDPQGLSLTYQWALLSKPSGSNAVLSGTTIPDPTFVADLSGTYVAQLIVNNGYLNSAPSTVTITTSNTAPVANAGPNQTVIVGNAVTLNGSGSYDADGDALSYLWSFLSRPTGSTAIIVPVTAVSPKFLADVAGTFVAQLIVTDGIVSSNASTVTVTAGVPPPVVITVTPSPLNLVVNATGTLTITLSAAAGTGGQTINLLSSNVNAATVPATVMVPQGATSVNVTVTPTGVGGTTITAAAPSCTPGAATVNVSAVQITLGPNPLTVNNNTTGSLTVTLSSPAGTGGQLISLSSSNTSVAKVPATVLVPQGSVSASVTVTPTAGASGNVIITASSSTGFTSGTATVTVVNVAQIILPTVTLALGQTVSFPVTLAQPASQSGGVFLSLTSSNTAQVTVSPASVLVPQGATAPTSTPKLSASDLGTVTITVSAYGLTSATEQITTTATVGFLPNSLTIASPGSKQYVTLSLSAPAPSEGVTLNLSSNNPAVATVQSTVTIAGGTTTATVPVTGVAAGSTVINASALPNIANATASVVVN